MRKDLISIIVPVYNVEKYLERCVDSIISQTYKDIEIILVDDGSTDNSGKMCDELTKKDNRIRVFHKKNGGLSDARNYGIDKAKGKYIGFVDSDDFVSEDMCEILYNDIISTNADVAMCNLVDCYGSIPKINNTKVQRCLFTPEDAIKCVMMGEKVKISTAAKLYKSKIFNYIKFEKGKTYEDAIIMVELLDRCKKISYNSSQVYYYVHRENSITTKKFNDSNYDVLYAYEKNYKIIAEKYPNILNIAHTRLCWARFIILEKMTLSNCALDKDIMINLKKNFFSVMRCNYLIGKFKKISLLFLLFNKKLYKWFVKLYYQKRKTNFD